MQKNANLIHHVEKKGAVQSAIIIGKEVLNRDSEDYPLLTLATTVLGGYFGSRLMGKIREEKGLTYGIFSTIQAKPKGAMFSIQSEVIAERTQEAIDEIFSEISRLSDEVMNQEELDLVRNYSMGGIMRSFDGPFQLIDRLKLTHAYGLDADSYYQKIVDDLLRASTDDIARIVKEQLNPNQMYVLTAGAK
jgi:predicted Zn-dependent peptidase